jgi:hypothetical protein
MNAAVTARDGECRDIQGDEAGTQGVERQRLETERTGVRGKRSEGEKREQRIEVTTERIKTQYAEQKRTAGVRSY